MSAQIFAFEGAPLAEPFPLPAQLVPVLQPPPVPFQRLAGPPPLLEPPLPFGSGGSTAADTASCVAVRLELVITFPPAVCALRPGEPFWPGSPCPFGDPI